MGDLDNSDFQLHLGGHSERGTSEESLYCLNSFTTIMEILSPASLGINPILGRTDLGLLRSFSPAKEAGVNNDELSILWQLGFVNSRQQ